MWYGVEVIEWNDSEWNNINTVLLVDLKTWWNEQYYDSSAWSDLIK